MDDEEGREQPGSPEAQDASLEEEMPPGDEIAADDSAAPEAEDAASSVGLADDDSAEQTSVTHVEPVTSPAEVTAVIAPEQAAVTQVVPTAPAAEPIAVTEVVPAPEPATDVVLVRKHNRLRSTLVGVLVVLTCLSLVATGVSWWVHYSIFNTNGYMKLVGPVGKDPEAIRALSDYIAGQVITATDLEQRTATALPPKAQFLAGPITGAVNQFIADGTDKVLSTPQAYDLWLKINTVAHDKIVALLRGETTLTYIQGNDVKLDTLPLISQVLVWVDGKLPGGLGAQFSPPVIPPGTPTDQATQQVSAWLGRPLPADFGQITLLQNDSLGAAQQAVRLFDALIWVLLIVTLVLAALTIWLSGHRRRTIIELGIGAAIALILTRVIVKQASTALIDSIHAGTTVTVLKDVVNAALGPLTNLTIWIVVIGLVVAVAAWFAGRRDLQAAAVNAGKRVVQSQDEALAAESPFTDWLERHAQWARLAGLIVGLPLLLWVASSWWSIVLLIVVVALYEGAISLLIRQWPFAHREKVGGASA